MGNEFNFSPKWHAYFDWMYSREGVDRKGIITNIVGTDNQAHNAFNAEYMSYVLQVNYRFAPKWNLFAKGMYETASVYKASGKREISHGMGICRRYRILSDGEQSALLPGIRGAFL